MSGGPALRADLQDTPASGSGEVEAIVAAAGPLLARRMGEVAVMLGDEHQAGDAALDEHARATIAAGGKRLRPLLVLLAAEAGAQADGGGDEDVVRAAVAVELVHSATLVHDDILDGADLRRGHPTVVAGGGRAMAVATGDLLYARAFALLTLNASGAQLRALSEASSALAAGELLQREDAWDTQVSEERYLRRCEHKTGRLFEAACRMGALSAGAPAARVQALGAFANRIGLAFQVLDDVLDVSGPAARTGKRRGTDLLDGTVTLPLILARRSDPGLGRVDLRRLLGVADAERLCDRIAATGALEECRRRALQAVAEAKEGLPRDLAVRPRRLLELTADAMVERYA